MSESHSWGGTIRNMWLQESEKFRGHLSRLDRESRRTYFGTALLGALLVTGAGIVNAGATDTASRIYQPFQGLSYNFGSKLAVGYFAQKDGACALNLFVAENTGDGTGPSAARLQVKVAPGESINLNAAEGQALQIKCGEAAARLEVRGGSVPARYAQR